jgi:PAS domain S-box-containing protein
MDGKNPKLFEALVDLYPDDAVFVVDGDRRIRFWSEGATRLLGFRREDVVGEHCLKSNRCSNCVRGCGIAELGRVEDVPLTMFREDGERVRVRKTARAFFDDQGRFAGGIEVLRPDPSAPLPSDDVSVFHGLVSRHVSMHAVFQRIAHVAESDATVLVEGEIGTGKELVARALHAQSPRAERAFVPVSCSALTESLAESTLFGHRPGALVGAAQDRAGLFAEAHGGTLFLDEVAELSPELQAKLLRVLEDKEIRPVGSTRPVPVDVRVVAATHRGLRAEVAKGRFREDLLFRLRVVPIEIPPLRSRPTDIEPLLWHFLEQEAARGGREVRRVEPEVMRTLLEYRWPGNVRELKNAIQYACAVGRGPHLSLRDLPTELQGSRRRPEPASDSARVQSPPSEADTERQRILWALSQEPHDLEAAAKLLGVSRATFWRRRKKYGLA